jgi:hypothetical protein
MRHESRYLRIEFYGWLLWGDVVRITGKALRFFGLACRHPKAAQQDYGRKCGICEIQLGRNMPITRPAWMRRIAEEFNGFLDAVNEAASFFDWRRR